MGQKPSGLTLEFVVLNSSDYNMIESLCLALTLNLDRAIFPLSRASGSHVYSCDLENLYDTVELEIHKIS